jgi:hypothetical protein
MRRDHAVRLAHNSRPGVDDSRWRLIAFAVDRHFVTVPNPAPLFVCIVALASSISGIVSGLISAPSR